MNAEDYAQLRQHVLINSYWSHFLSTYGENPYFATMLWVAKVAEWQAKWGLMN